MASKKLKQALMAGLAGAALAGSAKMKGESFKKRISSNWIRRCSKWHKRKNRYTF
jgi:hypothetical protein